MRGCKGFLSALTLVLLSAFLVPTIAPLPLLAAEKVEEQALDYGLWGALADEAEKLLDSRQASEAELNEIRSQAVRWRERFQAAQSPHSARLAALKSQLDALGPAPAEGKTEPEEVAARRVELGELIAQEQAPALRAAESFGRADSIIQLIDRQLRERQASALLRLSPSPLLPSSIAAAVTEAGIWGRAALVETKDRYESRPEGSLRERLPSVLALAIMAFLTLGFGRRTAATLPKMLSPRASLSARAAISFLTSVFQVVIPYLGVLLAVRAVMTSGMLGSYLQPLIVAIPPAALVYLIARWVVVHLFPADSTRNLALEFSEPARRLIRRQGGFLALLLALFTFATPAILSLGGWTGSKAVDPELPQPFTEAAAAVWHMPLILLASMSLFRFGHILRRTIKTAPRNPTPYRYKAVAVIGEISRLVAVISPLAAMAGYVSAANSLLWPWLSTLGLFGIVLLVQQFLVDIWVILRRGDEAARETLVPVLIGFGLSLAALPLLALTWGSRVADLKEMWTQIRHGVRLGGITISPTAMITFFVVFSVVYVATRAMQGVFRNSILPKTRMDSGAQNALVSGLGYIGIFFAALMAITSAGIDLSSLAIVAGALSVGIGFGMQNIVSNFVSGIILLIERPVAVGDWIQVGTVQGYVRSISVRSTMIETFDRSDVILPNSDLITGTVVNMTRGNQQGRIILPVVVSHDSDTRLVAKILVEVAEDQPLILISPAPVAQFTGFGQEGLSFELRVFLSDINQGVSVATEMRHLILARFREEGVEIPYATRNIWLRTEDGKNPEKDPEKMVGNVIPT